MTKGISFTRIWSDDDLIELRIVVANEGSSFSNTVYASQRGLQHLAEELSLFRDHIHAGVKDIRLGEFGPEYANGAFHARLHFRSPGKLYVSTHQQSEFSDFSVTQVASEARMFLTSEPVLLDNFLAHFLSLVSGAAENASLECI
ncbi:hypothetical protein [Pseudoxanthomonas sp. PXM02]|uniref:hypothetical protein n=1 Tax=Pseudoxanthomonas sp. PXM02 TaxID=2769294 RepID=UPI001782E74D|nr:hypothetical protein [Pseudoxanthomonas sp. PXM02]MBD9478978.1 hypothetical protein [Pseudoxanthomonas sp. PXM02]